jgi:hypothetical protein
MSKKRVSSFEEACKAQGLNPFKILPDVSCLPEADQNTVTALAKMCIINRSLNGKWKADWNDLSQYKYYPWFNVEEKKVSASGFGLSCDGCGYAYSAAGLGVRLFYKDAETAKYAGETFIELYEALILVPR